jgi:hypothetical protein
MHNRSYDSMPSQSKFIAEAIIAFHGHGVPCRLTKDEAFKGRVSIFLCLLLPVDVWTAACKMFTLSKHLWIFSEVIVVALKCDCLQISLKNRCFRTDQ